MAEYSTLTKYLGRETIEEINIIDKFHVKQNMLKARDEVRREEQGKTQSRKRSFGRKLFRNL